MLTKDLVRTRHEGDRLRPLFLSPTPAVLAGTAAILAFYRAGIGHSRAELQETAPPVLHRMRSLVVARGLQKLVLDRCGFTDPVDVGDLRWRALEASARALAAPAASAEDHRTAVATELDLAPADLGEGLYADLPHQARLESVPEWSEEELIDRYNLALVQGLVIRCGELELVVDDPDVGRRRQLLKNLRFHRLLAAVSGVSGTALRLTVSGPGSVIHQASRYGLQLANFVPAVTALRSWRLRAEVPGRGGGTVELGAEDGLRAPNRFLAYRPEELRDLVAVLAAKRPDWALDEEPPLLAVPGGDLVVPDFALRFPERQDAVPVELFHRWHRHALARRLDQLAGGAAPTLVLGIDRSLARLKEAAPLVARAEATGRSFLFSGYPTPRALARLAGAGG